MLQQLAGRRPPLRILLETARAELYGISDRLVETGRGQHSPEPDKILYRLGPLDALRQVVLHCRRVHRDNVGQQLNGSERRLAFWWEGEAVHGDFMYS